MEETGVTVKAGKLIGIRFNEKDWYSVFIAEYIEGEARPDAVIYLFLPFKYLWSLCCQS